MIEGKRPERVLVKNDLQIVTCPACKKEFTVPDKARNANCPSCGQSTNWGLGR